MPVRRPGSKPSRSPRTRTRTGPVSPSAFVLVALMFTAGLLGSLVGLLALFGWVQADSQFAPYKLFLVLPLLPLFVLAVVFCALGLVAWIVGGWRDPD